MTTEEAKTAYEKAREEMHDHESKCEIGCNPKFGTANICPVGDRLWIIYKNARADWRLAKARA